MSSAIEIYNRALSRVGISQFISDPNEQSQAGNFYRLWYDTCVQTCLRAFPWNFASRVVALTLLDGNPMPGWAYKYAYPIDCLMAHSVSDANGIRAALYSPFQNSFSQPYNIVGRLPIPFQVMSEAPTATTARRVINTDMGSAYLFYTAQITDPNQFDIGFTTALEWLIAAEVAAPFLGAPTGPQVAASAGQQYRNAITEAKAQTLNESTDDTRPDSIAITARA